MVQPARLDSAVGEGLAPPGATRNRRKTEVRRIRRVYEFASLESYLPLVLHGRGKPLPYNKPDLYFVYAIVRPLKMRPTTLWMLPKTVETALVIV